MESNYQILCFEHGKRPSAEIFDAYRCYAYEVFMEAILQGIIAHKLEDILDDYKDEEKLLILDMQKTDGRPATMDIINAILKARLIKSKPTVLVGEYIPMPILSGINGWVLFVPDGVQQNSLNTTERARCTDEF